MRRIYFFFLPLLLLTLSVSAQHTIKYHYDKAGRRVERIVPTIVVQTKSKIIPVRQDSVEAQLAQAEVEHAFTPSEDKPFVEDVNALRFTIYPNPTEGLLVVRVDNLPFSTEKSSIRVHSMFGALVLEQQAVLEVNNVDITSQPSGLYVLSVSVNGKTTTFKILKK